jgi:septal ring-binding cell division protein DamX
VKWYSMAARQGSDTATYNLLLMHEEGRATTQDLDLAFAGRTNVPDGVPAEPPADTITVPSSSRSWLAQLPAEQHLLQLVAASNAQALEQFAAKHLDKLTPQPRIVFITSNRRDWYVLLVGPFDTREQAKEMLGQLPDAVKKNKPWIRTVASLQKIAKPVD